MKIEGEQEVLMNIADMSIKTLGAESCLLRAMKLHNLHSEGGAADAIDTMRIYLNDAVDIVNKAGKEAINSFSDGDEQRMMLLGLKRFTKYGPFNSKDARRRIAQKLIAAGKYCF